MPVASITHSLTEALTSLVGDYGLYAVFLLMLIDAVLPAASELVMVYGGAVAAGAFAGQNVTLFGADLGHGFTAYLAIALAGTIGYAIGGTLGWWIGRYGGRPLLERHGRWLHLDQAKLARAERWFDRWGDWGVFLGRITPVVRSFVSIPAGVFEVKFARYNVLTLIGSAIWAFAFAGVGYGLGSRYESFHHAFRIADYLVAAGVVAGLFYLILRRKRSSTLKRRASDTPR
jgi:membrane protein DedA with SNARE-associated domain